MFTGIIEETGKIDKIIRGGSTWKIRIACSKVLGSPDDPYDVPTKIGDSIAVNGICLTVTDIGKNTFTADVMPETLSRTSLNGAAPGSPVDLERAMPAYGRFGGHIVSGHIDGTGKVVSVTKDGNAVWYEIKTTDDLMAQIVEKGSIAIDGISLTVASVSEGSFKVSIIPHTISETVLPFRKAGSVVNLETDIIGKYTRKFLGEGSSGDPDQNPHGKSDKDKRGGSLSDRALYELL